MGEVAAVRSPAELSYSEFAREYLRITPKKGGIVRFELNEVQLRIDQVIEQRLSAGRPVRLIVLKARQEGVSTYSLGRMYQYSTCNEGVTSFLAAHDDESTRDLFERVRLMYDLAPVKPMRRISNRTELDFANPDRHAARFNPGLQSKIRIGTAGRATLGRSKTLRYLHLSEVAFWDNAKRVLLGLEQALPDDAGTVEIIESTANGVGGEFYDRWKRAENPRTAGDWVAVFLPWWEFREYTRPLDGGVMEQIPAGAADEESFEHEERQLVALYGLTVEQLNWRRWAIANKCSNSLELFRQEYPASADEAFLTSGRPIFNREKLGRRLQFLQAEDQRRAQAREGPRGVTGRLVRYGKTIKFVPSPSGELTVYRFPERHGEYYIGGDACKGGKGDGDPDYAEYHVYNRHHWEQCAVYRARVEASEFSSHMMNAGYFYNTALLIPESNDHGHTVCVRMQDEVYPNVYLRQRTDVLGMQPEKKPGWENNRRTRPLLVDALDHGINNNLLIIHDIPTIQQLLTFVRNPETGKAEADKGCHDDGVIASGLATVVMSPVGHPETPKSSPVDLDRLAPTAAMISRDVKRHVHAYQEARRAKWGYRGGG